MLNMVNVLVKHKIFSSWSSKCYYDMSNMFEAVLMWVK